MALVKCRECQESISEDASTCPKCGFVLRKPRRSLFGKLIVAGFVVFNCVMLVWCGQVAEGGTELLAAAANEAEQAGAKIGTSIGLVVVWGIWALGDVVLGILIMVTRPSSD